MKTEKNILVAFLLNLLFSAFEFMGGLYTGSVAILSDALHDLGDAIGIGLSYFLEKKSKCQPDMLYTYGYRRFSVLGSVVTTCILLLGSATVIYNAIGRLLHPTPIRYTGMIVFALVGVCVNGIAAFVTRGGRSMNQKAVNLHMLEDVLGWLLVLVGAVVMRFTDLRILDPVLSMGIALFIGVNAARNLKEAVYLFLERTPKGIAAHQLAEEISALEDVEEVHHIHFWSLDGERHCATMHIVTDGDSFDMKKRVRELLGDHGIVHATLELERPGEDCLVRCCRVEHTGEAGCCHHHHHH